MSAAEQQHNLYKKQAAEYAVTLIHSGMVVGLGMGSTALYAVQHIAKLYAQGELSDIVGVPCGSAVEAEARRLGLPIANIDDHPQIDLTIDGADEVDPQLNLIKGGGAALLREKIVAQSTRREVIIVDQSKLSEKLGTVWALPVEVIPFGWATQARWIASLGAEVKLRTQSDGSPLKTDQGNLLLDCKFGPIADPHSLADQLAKRAGIVEHGLFLGLTSDLIIAGADGIRHVDGPYTS